ncbi:MAG TPA: flagellar hook capping FlgD N-terminal domain-containing protein [Polyangiaceae bacterium]|nr:flagellar hook capping FlgD N-terminal domain-containing protein [Polyangiaceae bacterium]
MATNSVTSTQSTTQDVGSIASAMTGGKGMGKDDFLKLLVAQLKNQDPLAPQDNTQFVAQLAQFSSLEQSMGINDRLDALTAQFKGLSNTGDIGLVGSTIAARGNLITVDGSGAGAQLSFTLGAASDSTKIGITDSTGRTVRTLDIGKHAAGIVRVMWDGRDDTGIVQPAGTYAVTVQAKTADGGGVSVDQQSTGVVKAISFDKGYPVLELDSGLSIPVSDLLKVVGPTKP